VVNPGSASRKYALFSDGVLRASVYFEYINEVVSGKINYLNVEQSIDCEGLSLGEVVKLVVPKLIEVGAISSQKDISVIGIRLVAPSQKFMRDELVTDGTLAMLEKIEQVAPLHVSTVLAEIKQLRKFLSDTPIVTVSDSAFHETKPTLAWSYAIDTELADRLGIKRYGYHGISVGSVVRRLKETDIIKPKTIVCHLGSGSSVTAVYNGDSYDNTMGYSPLEGLMMATRSGNIDPAAVMTIKRELRLNDNEIENYLNTKCGLLGVSGSSNDIRKLLESEEKGDERASLALELFVYKIQQAIGQMSASLGGVDCLVFTGTVGERSYVIRARILEKLVFLGFHLDNNLNNQAFEPKDIANIATPTSKPVYVVSTNEALEIATRAEKFINDFISSVN